ncbi:LSU ribosomal protein L6p (L9e) [Candidatus Vidania fulgoroideae]|nr:LSU ribosomal protein L6p (L9e) [Candidatus Vidania fulgoroideae]
MSKNSLKGINVKNVEIIKKKDTLKIFGRLGSEKIRLKYKYIIFLKKKRIFINMIEKNKFSNSLLGTYHSIIKNLVKGVNKGFKVSLAIDGLGYYAKKTKDKKILFELGFSHFKFLEIEKKINVEILEKGKRIDLLCTNNVILGNFINKIITLRKYNLYKGKGIRFYNEEKIFKQRKKK